MERELFESLAARVAELAVQVSALDRRVWWLTVALVGAGATGLVNLAGASLPVDAIAWS